MLVCGGGGFLGYNAWQFQQIKEGVQVKEEVAQKRKLLVESRNIEENLADPLTASQVDAFRSTIQTWKESDAFQHIKELEEMDENQSGDPSAFQQVRAVWKVWTAAASVQRLGGEYVEAIEENGGIEAHYGRVQRVGAVIAAVSEVGSGRRLEDSYETTSDELAEVIYKRHDEVMEAYSDRIKALESKEDASFQDLAAGGNLGIYALAALPKESFEPWYELSPEERQKVMDTFAWTLIAEGISFGGLAYPIDFGKSLPIPG